MYAEYSYLTVNSRSSSSNGASDSGPTQAGNLVVLLVPVSAATQISCILPVTTRSQRNIYETIKWFNQRDNR